MIRRPVLAILLLVATSAATARADPDVAPSAGENDPVACADRAEEGQRLRDQGRLVAARALFVACAQSSCPKVVVESCRRWLDDVDERLPSLAFAVRSESGQDLADVAIDLDGAPWLTRLTGRSVPVDPGPHVLTFRAAGRSVEQRVVIREGERARPVTVTFAPRGLGASGASQVAGESSSPRSRVPGWPVVALGVGSVLSFAASVYFGVRAMNDYSALQGSCAPNCSSDELRSVRTEFVVSDVTLGAGIVTLGAAIALYLAGVRR